MIVRIGEIGAAFFLFILVSPSLLPFDGWAGADSGVVADSPSESGPCEFEISAKEYASSIPQVTHWRDLVDASRPSPARIPGVLRCGDTSQASVAVVVDALADRNVDSLELYREEDMRSGAVDDFRYFAVTKGSLSLLRLCTPTGRVETTSLPHQSDLLPVARITFQCPIGDAASIYVIVQSYSNIDTCHYSFHVKNKLISFIISGRPFCASDSALDIASFVVRITRDFGFAVRER